MKIIEMRKMRSVENVMERNWMEKSDRATFNLYLINSFRLFNEQFSKFFSTFFSTIPFVSRSK